MRGGAYTQLHRTPNPGPGPYPYSYPSPGSGDTGWRRRWLAATLAH